MLIDVIKILSVFAHTQIYYGGFGLNSILVPVTEMKNDYSMLAKFEERAVKEFIRQNNKNHIVRATKLNSIYLGEDWREEIIREFYELREGKCKYVIRDSVNSVILSEKKESKILYCSRNVEIGGVRYNVGTEFNTAKIPIEIISYLAIPH